MRINKWLVFAVEISVAVATSGCVSAETALPASADAQPAATVVAPAKPENVEVRHLLVADVSAERIEKDIRTLVGFGTRHTLSETESNSRGIGAARRWVEQEFRRISAACGDCLEVFTVSDVNTLVQCRCFAVSGIILSCCG